MHDGDIDYSRYTLLELEEAFAGINKHKYPKNYANLCSAYELLGSTLPSPPQAENSAAVDDIEEDWPQPKYDENGRYIPNLIPSGERANHIIFSLLLFAYGGYGVWVNDLYIPGKRSRGVHLHDVPAWLMCGAMICACIVMLSVVADHYDRRNNERHYRIFAEVGKFFGWALFGVSLFWAIFQ
ncbi:hypothetical protein J2X06_001099 [Lysobacter niastensis]|uniref:Uncharacterized protein n=1 Tax=Lysobacter niastensis TaxID=380629 RepID=A0ABU1W9B2_9GAMM|nr:hypothetical protein [Lysobacter niastensis]MDR7133915.1 hypothetical protein [Lysobacter niastensis]